MKPFRYAEPQTIEAALLTPGNATGTAGTEMRHSRFIAGGTNILDLMKEGVEAPAVLVSINRLPLAAIEADPHGGLRLGALARNADTAEHPLVRQRYPVLRSAILAGASPQLRNMATNGGNLLQRTRCYYFYDVGVPCNKREPGSGCPASTGLARQHAILGASPQCVATHPSDMCVALAALAAVVHVRSRAGDRQKPFAAFHRLPGDQPDIDTTLGPDELITHIVLPDADRFAAHSTYLKIRERASYAFALVSVAAMLDLGDDGVIRGARLTLGGVAHKPWRNEEAEHALVGKRPAPDAFSAVADIVLADARGWGGPGPPDTPLGSSFKIPLARRAIIRALEMATSGIPTNTGEDAARLR